MPCWNSNQYEERTDRGVCKIEEKKAQVIASIEEQGKLTEELKKQIEQAQTQVVVDDLYRPYRPKRRTRATIAKEKAVSRNKPTPIP